MIPEVVYNDGENKLERVGNWGFRYTFNHKTLDMHWTRYVPRDANVLVGTSNGRPTDVHLVTGHTHLAFVPLNDPSYVRAFSSHFSGDCNPDLDELESAKMSGVY